MRGARHYRPDVSTHLKKCSEHIGDDCTLCCSVTPCAYCLELEIYGSAIQYGYAPESANHWTGTVDGHSFDAYWERNQYTDECEFVVELDGVEVYRKSCYEGQSCRDSSDEVAVTIGYDEATLRWTKHEPLELPHIIGDAGCPTWFCGECECSCDRVCVTITPNTGNIFTDVPTAGELENVSYPCDGPVWTGTITGVYDIYELSFALGRDSYGNCILTGTVDGEDIGEVAVSGCKDMSASFTLYDGTTVAVRCKVCVCESTVVCDYCCLPMDFTNPLYPLGVMSDIPFSITGCLTYNGVFRTEPGNEPCQAELIYDDVCKFGRDCGTFLQTAPITKYTETGGVCSTTPCNATVAYKLECTARYNEPGDDQSCDRLWLWIGASAITQVGDIGETPGGYVYTGFSWRRVRADSCMCDNTDGLVASFNADVVADCTGADTGYDGACAGQPLDCCPINCASTLVI